MAKQTEKGITWCDETWNPIRGCSRVSEGCRLCYAERVAARFSGPGMAYEGLAKMTAQGEPRWTGAVRLIEDHLEDPLRWKRPRKIFTNSMSDLFHEGLADSEILRVFEVMRKCAALDKGHIFQILTKRAKRMQDFCSRLTFDPRGAGRLFLSDSPPVVSFMQHLKNIWMGVSCEDQKTADERIPLLLQTPAAIRWVSYEPALGPVDFISLPSANGIGRYLNCLNNDGVDPGALIPSKLNWIVIGGESGPGARPFDIKWARSTIAQCKAAGTACFVKQLGAMPYEGADWYSTLPPLTLTKNGVRMLPFMNFKSKKAGDISEWPDDLKVREYPNA